MAQTGHYKMNHRNGRMITSEETYAGGMRFVDTPLEEGVCRSLINFDIRDTGAALIPRPGYRTLHSALVGSSAMRHNAHHIAQGTVLNTDTNEDLTRRYVQFENDNNGDAYFDIADSPMFLEDTFIPEFGHPNQVFASVPYVPENAGDICLVRRNTRPRTQLLHNISLSPTGVFTYKPYQAVQTQLNGFTILPVRYIVPGTPDVVKNGFGKLVLTQSIADGYKRKVTFLDPKEITPTEAINYGYNMLSPTPYTFNDVLSDPLPANYIIMEGILPYADEACTQIKMNARVGEKITFRLYSQWPDDTSKFKFRWEIREIGADTATVYEDQATTAKEYNFDTTKGCAEDASGNNYVRLTLQPPFKQFSVTVTAYASSDLTEPIQVLALGSYTMSADNAGSMQNIEPRSYALHTAKDMTTWRQRVVLWGVQGAPNTIFMSDINDPTYFPYPNNCEVFDEAVIACVPYLGKLLVFTESKLYKLEFQTDGITFTTEMIQDKLSLSEFDRGTILLVQNMVFFKNGNYFYMVVPRTSSTTAGALQLAPISTPITQLLDDFEETVVSQVFDLYNPSDSTFFPPLTSDTEYGLRLQDYHNYLDGTVIRNVYKYELVRKNKTTGVVVAVMLCLDYVLNYNASTRAWTTYIVQSGRGRLLPYRQSVTDATVFLSAREQYVLSSNTYRLFCDFVKPDKSINRDDFPLPEDLVIPNRVIPNHQMLDTGYRNHSSNYKKRYRELQLRISGEGEEALQFGTEFLLDDQLRKSRFEYVTRQVIDPTSSDYGWTYVERVLADPVNVAGAAVLDDDPSSEVPYLESEQVVPDSTIPVASNRWLLDISQLAHVVARKVKIGISGKGHAPRFILLSFNDRPYELLAHAWVYRVMNAR